MNRLQSAILLHQQGKLSEAGEIYQEILKKTPECFDALHMSGVLSVQIGRMEDAEAYFSKAKTVNPGNAVLHFNYGVMLEKLKRREEAVTNYRAAISLNQNYPEAHGNCAIALRALKRFEEAIEHHQNAIGLKPNNAVAHFNYGETLQILNRFEEAVSSYARSISIKPDFAEAYHNRAIALRELGRFAESLESSECAIKFKPGYNDAYSNFLFTSNLIDDFPFNSRVQKAREFGSHLSRNAEKQISLWQIDPSRSRLRIAFVSGDFKKHPVGYFLISLIENMDASAFEIYAYTNNSYEDSLTLRLKKCFTEYKSIAGMSDVESADLIRSDQIQILIDLSGHTALNRLPLFALKPAPVQASWLGYCGTTGVPEMDYIFADDHVVPAREEGHFTEKIKRLANTYFCFSQPDETIEISNPPVLKNQCITFGSFNNILKLSPEVIQVWASILSRVEGSRLFLKAAQLENSDIIDRTLKAFGSYGISKDRIFLEGKTDRLDYFRSYNLVDIALDPFPYPGATTSIEALWMGVPVLTRMGNNFISHNGETIAHNCGQADWIAADNEDYVEKAVNFSSDIPNLVRLRAGLRDRLSASPLFDGAQFARHYERALREVWAEHEAANQDGL